MFAHRVKMVGLYCVCVCVCLPVVAELANTVLSLRVTL